ncbi:interleukin 17-like protein [Argopecten irradians]|uniref:interleukin 17-like protein n=1 Tax=Argopecten irradians TaxID=31199 RepID=UPI00371B32B3
MTMISIHYPTAVTEGTVTRTPELVDPRGPAFMEDRLRAVCPWSYVRNEDPERIPRVIFEAKCIQSSCHGCEADTSTLPVCSEVYYYASVMRKTGCYENGSYRYARTTQRISAGCSCLRPAGSIVIPVHTGYPEGDRANP